MWDFFRNLLGYPRPGQMVEPAVAPYKVEVPVAVEEVAVLPPEPVAPPRKPVQVKITTPKAVVKKPRKPRAPKA